jgi:hypothetical protein
MPINKISPTSIKKLGVKSLLSDEYMMAFFKKFCTAIESRTWRLKRAKNARYEDIDFLKVFFLSEITSRSIHETSEMLNVHYLSHKKGRQKRFADRRQKRFAPHQTEVNKHLRKIGFQKARKILRECIDDQLQEALIFDLISRKVNVLIDFTEHSYYGSREDKMIKGANRQKGTKKCVIILDFRFFLEESIYTQD